MTGTNDLAKRRKSRANDPIPTFEWQIVENDAGWYDRLAAGAAADRSASAQPWSLGYRRTLWGLLGVALLLIAGGYPLWHTALGTLSQPSADVTATAQATLDTVAPSREALIASVIGDLRATGEWGETTQPESALPAALQYYAALAQVEIAPPMIELQGDQAVVNIVTTVGSAAPVYRQTLFYQHTTEGWQQAAPDADLWGPEGSKETPYFLYFFRQNDSPVVSAVAPQVDELYVTMRRNVGLPVAPVGPPAMYGVEKRFIDVSVTLSPGQALPWHRVHDRLLVPSPALYLAPVEVSDTDLLAQSIALPLLKVVLAQAKEHHAIGWSWQPLLNGLYLWQIWELDLPLSLWREDVVKWLYLDLPGIGPGQALVLPERNTALCASHTLWTRSPAFMGIPLLCSEPDWERWFFVWWGSRDSLTRLDQLTLSMPSAEYMSHSKPSYERRPDQTVALATLIEYVVATYGRERLPQLVAALGQYETWDTLLPALYGVSPAEFEAGWHAYLAVQYGD